MARPSLFKSELAHAYAPEIGERSALNRLSRWIRLNEALSRALRGDRLPADPANFYDQTGGTDFLVLGKAVGKLGMES